MFRWIESPIRVHNNNFDVMVTRWTARFKRIRISLCHLNAHTHTEREAHTNYRKKRSQWIFNEIISCCFFPCFFYSGQLIMSQPLRRLVSHLVDVPSSIHTHSLVCLQTANWILMRSFCLRFISIFFFKFQSKRILIVHLRFDLFL